MTSRNQELVGEVSAEIETIVKELEDSFNAILDAAEKIDELADSAPEAAAEQIRDSVGFLYTSSGVQDLAGQRLTRIRQLVEEISALQGQSEPEDERKRDKSSEIEEKYEDGSASERDLLNGPQLPGSAASQQEVDALFENLD